MEKVKNVHSTSLEQEQIAGTATYPDILEVASHTSGRSIDDNVKLIKIKQARDFYEVKNQGRTDHESKARMLLLNGADQGVMPTNLLIPHPETQKIHLPKIVRQLSVDREKVLPKKHSVAGIIQFSLQDTLPKPDYLLGALLLEDDDYEAATAAFFLTYNDKLYKFARSDRTPQLSKPEMNKVLGHYLNELKLLEQDQDIDQNSTREAVLRVMTSEFGLQFYSGYLNTLRLYKGDPKLLSH